MFSFGRKKYRRYDQRKKRPIVIVALLPVVLLSAWLGYSQVISGMREPAMQQKPKTEPTQIQKTESKTVEGRYLFSGTIVLARAVERAAAGDYNQPFSQLSTFEPDKYDAWLADLECPITSNNVSYQQQIDNLVFNCRPEWLPTFSKYFSLVNLANNHTSDMGADGFIETQKNLDNAGIQAVGSYDPVSTQDACEVIALPVRVVGKDRQTTNETLPVGFCAFHYFFRKPNPGEMDIVKQYSEIMPTFGFMHVGVEYLPTAGTEQQNVAHSLIDLGSEFVIGNSPHWVQNSEVYKGKPIFYSTGNFIFDQLEYETNRGLSIAVEVNTNYDDNLAKWFELGKECRKRRDDCLKRAKEMGLTKPNLTMTYEPIGSKGGNREVTRKADAPLQSAIEERLNWTATKKQLGQ